MLKSNITRIFTVVISLFTAQFFMSSMSIAQNSSNEQTESWETSKKGGVCFRVYGTHSVDTYSEYSELFNERDKKFNFSIGLSSPEVSNAEYIDGIKSLQKQGHELLDATPNYRTNYFITIFDTLDYENAPGVQNLIGDKVCLEFAPLDPLKRKMEGYVNIFNNKVFSENEFKSFNEDENFLYFPSLNKLVLINNILAPDFLEITDVYRDPIDLGKMFNVQYYLFSSEDIHLTEEALILLGNESLKLSEHYGIERPYIWNHPSGKFPTVSKKDLAIQLGSYLDYISGSVYDSKTSQLKTYNENNDEQYREFGMRGNFRLDELSLEEMKTLIADGVAKHHILFSHSTFGDSLGNLSGYLYKTEALLDWLQVNEIAVATQSYWSNHLYKTVQNPYAEVMPPLNSDIDGNNIPDGYHLNPVYYDSRLDATDGAPNAENYSIKLDKIGGMTTIPDLGGIEKGENIFEIWTKGSEGSFITIKFEIGSEIFRYKLPAENQEWTKYDLSQSLTENKSLFIPDSVNTIYVGISCTELVTGEVKISGMSLKSAQIDEISPSTPQHISAEGDINQVHLSWSPNIESDFEIYKLYRSTDAKFNPDTLTYGIYTTSDTNFVDTNIEIGKIYFYKLAAYDFAGNKSEYSEAVSAFAITDIIGNETIPQKYEISQNYPNPFNPSTRINFALPLKSNVNLSIYNALGQKVEELINSNLSAGFHQVDFNADHLSSGIYFYRIVAGSFIEAKKMMLVK